MKRIFYIAFITMTTLLTFGFRGCELEYCEFLYNINSAVGRFSNEEGWEFFVAADSGIYAEDLFPCLTSLVGPEEAWNEIEEISFGFRGGPSYYCSAGNSGVVAFSSDGGNNWENRNIAGLTKNLYGLDFLNFGSSGLGIVVCGETGTMYVSTNSGSGWVWQEVNTMKTVNLNSVAAIDKSLFIVVGDSGTIMKTYDQGNSWEDHSVGGAKFNRIFDGGKVQAFGYLWIAGDNGRIYATTNYGISWFPQTSGVTDNLNDIQFRSQSEGIVVGDNGVVRYTDDGGTTWQADPYFNGLTDGDIISLSTGDFNTGIAVVRNTTLDGGSTSSMFVLSTEPLDVSENENTMPSQYSLQQNYPNPFNPTTKINYAIPQPEFVSLRVYDVLGKEIATLVNEEKNSGNYQVDFTGYGLSSGIYYYTLKAGNYSETRKLVLLK